MTLKLCASHIRTMCNDPVYVTPNDVPPPLRHMLRQAHESGLTVGDLALVYEMPEQWIELFVKPVQGHA